MIPKLIHYCWFGRGNKSELIEKCISGWGKLLPDYQIKEWNEDNFDIKMNQYVCEAYERKKYAFVADFVRLYVLYHYGGVYLDTDVEVLKSFDDFLDLHGFAGFEDQELVSTAILGFEKENAFIKEWMVTYRDKNFVTKGKLNTETNVRVFTNSLLCCGLLQNNQKQLIKKGEVFIYPKDYFSPLKLGTRVPQITRNTYTIHWYEGTWLTMGQRIKLLSILFVKKMIGFKNYNRIKYRIQRR